MRNTVLASLALAAALASPARAQTTVFSADHVGWGSWSTLNGWGQALDPDGNVNVIYVGAPDATPFGTPSTRVLHILERDGETGAERYHVEIPTPHPALQFGAAAVDGAGDVYALVYNFGTPNGASLIKASGADGSLLWTRAISEPRATGYTGYDVAIDSLGRVVTSASSNYFVTPQQLKSYGIFNAFGADGSPVWQVVDETGYGFGIGIGLDGDAFFVGRTLGDGTNDHLGNMTVVRVNANGTRVWQRLVDNNSQKDVGRRAMVDATGDVVAIGTSLNGGTGTTQFLARKMRRSNGQTRWTRIVDTGSSAPTGNEAQFRVAAYPNGDFVVAGSANGPTTRAFVMKVANGGALRWTWSDAMPHFNVAVDPEGAVFVIQSSSTTQKLTKLAGSSGAPLWTVVPPAIAIYNTLTVDPFSGRAFTSGYGQRNVSLEPLVREGLIRTFAVE